MYRIYITYVCSEYIGISILRFFSYIAISPLVTFFCHRAPRHRHIVSFGKCNALILSIIAKLHFHTQTIKLRLLKNVYIVYYHVGYS